jgi:glyoxylase-like metal-dependent hydrolase (beta-lactamase superfamily II)
MKRLLLITLAAVLLVLLLAPTAASAQENWWDILPRPEWSHLTRVETTADQGWFEVYKIRPNVYAFYTPGNYLESICYLFVGTKRAMLFDTSMNIGDLRQLTDRLTDKPVFVVNSHSDFDHVGCNYEYSQVWAFDDAEGVARYNAAHGLTHEEAVETGLVDPWSMSPAKTLPAHFDYDTYCVPPYTITHWVKDGDLIDLGNMKLKVYSTPGHSPNYISLLDRKHGLLVGAGAWNPVILPCDDLKAYTASAAKLARLSKQADYVLPGHCVTMVSAKWMVKMDHAFRAINRGTAKHYVDDTYPDNPEWNARIFDFGYFQVSVPWSELGLP